MGRRGEKRRMGRAAEAGEAEAEWDGQQTEAMRASVGEEKWTTTVSRRRRGQAEGEEMPVTGGNKDRGGARK